MQPDPDADETATSTWSISATLVRAALSGASADELVRALGQALDAAGIAVTAIVVSCDAVDPERAQHCVGWHRDDGAAIDASPASGLFQAMLENGATMRRVSRDARRLLGGGATDALALIEHLAPDATLGFFDDVMSLFVTNRIGGFAAEGIATLRHVTPVFALALGARMNADAARVLLRTYLGRDAATAMLDGRVGLGDVATMRAIVLYCDLADFTPTTERLDPEALIAHLNAFFDTITRPIARIGGQVAGHVGDAIVLHVTIPDPAGERSLCAAACRAALQALEDLGSSPAPDGARFRARIGIDLGDVVHGNIGSAGRFSFSIIGTPVNRAARLQALAKDLGAALLMPSTIADAAAMDCENFGTHALKGFDHPVSVAGVRMNR